MIITIIGSRNFPKLEKVREFILTLPEGTIVASGGALGVDSEAEKVAKERNFETIIYKPDWSLGNQAGLDRNTMLVAGADKVVAFRAWCNSRKCSAKESCPHKWRSHGTSDSVRKAKGANKLLFVLDVFKDGAFIKVGNGEI